MVSQVREVSSFFEVRELGGSGSFNSGSRGWAGVDFQSVPLSGLYQIRSSVTPTKSVTPTRRPYENQKEGLKKQHPSGLLAKGLARWRITMRNPPQNLPTIAKF